MKINKEKCEDGRSRADEVRFRSERRSTKGISLNSFRN